MRTANIFKVVILFVFALIFCAHQDVGAQNMFIRGDADCNGAVDMADVTYLNNFLFAGGPPPPCRDAADANDNGAITAGDVTYLINFLSSGGPPPPAPYPLCGNDPTADALTCAASCCPNHFKAYMVTPKLVDRSFNVKDQFMQDILLAQTRVMLANPVQKDSFNIADTTHHLSWYSAMGRDTLIEVNFKNQFESTTVFIDAVRFLLVPTRKFPHNPPLNLDHYKCYNIQQQPWLKRQPFMRDQFGEERADSLRRDLFCTPCQKNFEPMFDTITHYVGYLITPGQPLPFPFVVQAQDQVGTWVDTVLGSKYLLVPTNKILPQPPPDTGKNHYKTWRLQPVPLLPPFPRPQVRDQFMTDSLAIVQLEFLSNPVQKVVFGHFFYNIIDPDDHLTWYRVAGRDTLLKVEYENQFESTTVAIDSVNYLLVPAQKDGHLPPDSVDHYKAYRIRNPKPFFNPLISLDDQFDIDPEIMPLLQPAYFLTPCQKESELTYDTITHYVAYLIDPPTTYSGSRRTVNDQFFPSPGITIDVFNSQFLLVPTTKKSFGLTECSDGVDNDGDGLVDFPADCGCTDPGDLTEAPNPVTACSDGVDNDGDGLIDFPADPGCSSVCDNDEFNPVGVDTLRNHFKTWRVFTPPKDTFALVRDQFTIHDFLLVDSIDFLSNPVQKIVFGATRDDTSNILRPDDHLTWHRVKSSNNRRINVQVTYVNQFESTKVFIDTVKYFLLPTQKLFPSHPRPDSLLGHYTAYRIHKPKGFRHLIQLTDQFDMLMAAPEIIDSLVPRYFLTPAEKMPEQVFGPDTHYVAYEIFPKNILLPPGLPTQTIDQWGLHTLEVRNSEYLLVPSRKDTFVVCTYKPNDCNGDGKVDLVDIVCDVNVVFKNAPKPVPICRTDCNGSGGNPNLVDIVCKVNYVFKGGPEPVPVGECCIPVK